MDERTRSQDRRSFIANGLAGIIGTALLPDRTAPPLAASPPQSAKERSFVHRVLGKTGMKLSVVSMGSMINPSLVQAAFDSGITFIDTSSEHGNGNNERIIGGIVRRMRRDSFVIATSSGIDKYRDRRTGMIREGTSGAVLTRSLEGSLERLGLDYVDIYYLAAAWDRNSVLYEPFLKTLADWKAQGRTRFVGVTTHANEPEVIRAAVDARAYDVVMTAYNFRQQHRDAVREAIAGAAAAGLGVVAMKTQAGVYWDEQRKNMINMKAALKWALQEAHVHTAVPAFNSFQELSEGLSVMESLQLTPEEERDLKPAPAQGSAGFYCQQCGACLPQCAGGLDIPRLMRGHMYARAYSSPARAAETLSTLDASPLKCVACPDCAVNCATGFDVRRKVLDTIRIADRRLDSGCAPLGRPETA